MEWIKTVNQKPINNGWVFAYFGQHKYATVKYNHDLKKWIMWNSRHPPYDPFEWTELKQFEKKIREDVCK